jgi:hypothetical protein
MEKRMSIKKHKVIASVLKLQIVWFEKVIPRLAKYHMSSEIYARTVLEDLCGLRCSLDNYLLQSYPKKDAEEVCYIYYNKKGF